ncbi:MAG TPA: hydrogenase expression/formation protein HypE [Acidimicrobiales bacterium]|nr:hydrogenase expression/formation protein HypE [Acidimicrobiales bacterium]
MANSLEEHQSVSHRQAVQSGSTAPQRITMAHGAGGRSTHRLIESVFLPAFSNPALDALADGAIVGVAGQKLAFTTDSFVVSPIFFPGGCLGDLAVNGTLNDLAACGASPLALSAAFIVEEGFPVEDLRLIVEAMSRCAGAAGTSVVTGDTKVVRKGQGDGCYVNCSGIGLVSDHAAGLGAANARPGDRILVSGPIGDHGAAIMVARGDLGIEADIVSDTTALSGLVATLLGAAGDAVHVLRDPTRGGVATVLNEVASSSGTGAVVRGADVPVRPEVAGVCELLGLDPLYVACEGRMIAVVAPERADAALAAMRSHPAGIASVEIGTVEDGPSGRVTELTAFGGKRVLDMLVGDPLPRIC